MAIPPTPEDESNIADANLLFDDAPTSRSRPQGSAPRPVLNEGIEGYDIEGDEPDESPSPVVRAPIPPPRPKRKRAEVEPAASEYDPEEPASVSEVWSRWGEWGPTLIKIGAVGLGAVIFVYLFGGTIGVRFSALILMIAGLAMIALSYPIVITLERPIRMTPEQAVKDYYAALSHHYPAYRRMWLLLSDKGKEAREFGSFDAFRKAMIRRLGELRGTRVKSSTPLNFTIADFRSEKSAGLKSIDGSYTLNVSARGESGSPLASFDIKTSFVRGADSMWYLNSGVIPRET